MEEILSSSIENIEIDPYEELDKNKRKALLEYLNVIKDRFEAYNAISELKATWVTQQNKISQELSYKYEKIKQLKNSIMQLPRGKRFSLINIFLLFCANLHCLPILLSRDFISLLFSAALYYAVFKKESLLSNFKNKKIITSIFFLFCLYACYGSLLVVKRFMGFTVATFIVALILLVISIFIGLKIEKKKNRYEYENEVAKIEENNERASKGITITNKEIEKLDYELEDARDAVKILKYQLAVVENALIEIEPRDWFPRNNYTLDTVNFFIYSLENHLANSINLMIRDYRDKIRHEQMMGKFDRMIDLQTDTVNEIVEFRGDMNVRLDELNSSLERQIDLQEQSNKIANYNAAMNTITALSSISIARDASTIADKIR